MRRRQIVARAAQASPPLTLDQLREKYRAKFGRLPHWNMKAETIRERLNDD